MLAVAFPCRFLLAVALLGPYLAACVTKPVPLDPTALRSARGRVLLLVLQADEPFMVETSGLTSPGLAGIGVHGAAMTLSGASLAKEYHLESPTPALGRSVARDLASQFGLSLVTYIERSASSEDMESPPLIEPRPPADLVLAVTTSIWKLATAPTQWTHYAVHYGVDVELTDSRTERVLVRGSCVGTAPHVLRASTARSMAEADALVRDAPTYDEMLADEARLLKSHIARAAVRCEDSLRSELLFRDAQPPAPVAAVRSGPTDAAALPSPGRVAGTDLANVPDAGPPPPVKQERDNE